MCPLQQGCDSRWLHPRIYNWPDYESGLPNHIHLSYWTSGRASDVTDAILKQFEAIRRKSPILNVFLQASLRIDAGTKTITGTGVKRVDQSDRRTGFIDRKYNIIVVAAGFGLERKDPSYDSALTGGARTSLSRSSLLVVRAPLSCRVTEMALLSICVASRSNGFVKDTIIKELFGPALEQSEDELRAWRAMAGLSPDAPGTLPRPDPDDDGASSRSLGSADLARHGGLSPPLLAHKAGNRVDPHGADASGELVPQ